ncbi:transcriptional regulator swi6 [Podochytrium sp. JEL0797]|nr:transcriptional regulator swi6 [Podochytrium sp. JEL0797]
MLDVLRSLFDGEDETCDFRGSFDFSGESATRIVDASGNTLAHWAAGLGHVGLVASLPPSLYAGRNYAGETPLMRCAMGAAAYEKGVFGEVAAVLLGGGRVASLPGASLPGDDSRPPDDAPSHPPSSAPSHASSSTPSSTLEDNNDTTRDAALFASDARGRTVLHHICLSIAVKGRVSQARCYLDELAAAAAAARLTHHPAFAPFVNAKDNHGDTALLVAARMQDAGLVALLRDAFAADCSLKNNAGLAPADFMHTDTCRPASNLRASATPAFSLPARSLMDPMDRESTSSLPSLSSSAISAMHLDSPSLDPEQPLFHLQPDSFLALPSFTATLTRLQAAFSASQAKQLAMLEETKRTIVLLTEECELERRRKEALEVQCQNGVLLRKRVDKLEKAAKLREDKKKAVDACVKELVEVGCVLKPSEHDASLVRRDESKRDALERYINSKAEEERELMTKIDVLKTQRGHYEQLCKVLFTTCCNVDLEHADDLVGPLLQFLSESDANDDE